MMDHAKLWRDGLEEEKEFWRKWKGGRYHQFLLTNRQLRPTIAQCLPEWTKDSMVLDVGAGAVSVLGNHVKEQRIRITQLDALEDWFAEEFGSRPNRAYCRQAEDMQMGAGTYDLVCGINSIDHTLDPERVLGEIGRVSKGAVYLEHYVNCAILNNWSGLHQWNFELCHQVPVVWSDDRVIDVPHALGAKTWKAWFESRDQYRVLCISAKV